MNKTTNILTGELNTFLFYNFTPSLAKHIIDDKYASRKVHHNYPPFIIDNIKDGDTIFIKTDYLPKFFNIFHLIKSKFFLITGVAGLDVDIKFKKYLESDKIIKWLGTNILFKHKKIVKLPIGFEENELPGGNQILLKKLYDNKSLFDEKKNKLLLTSMGKTHHSRNKINNIFNNKQFVDILKDRLGFENFMKKINEYKFVLSPRGRGNDTHRFWEILLVGSIPVVETSGLDDLYNKFPCIIVSDFKDVNENLLNNFKIDMEKIKNIETYLLLDNFVSMINKEKLTYKYT
mgnify:CR=1 FL=1|tara:strand:- start:2083 stop:2952 length:870 start_codon:yes stop_codon:yes gene_type:complete